MSAKKYFLLAAVLVNVAVILVITRHPGKRDIDAAMRQLIVSASGKDPRLFSDQAHQIGHEIAHTSSSSDLAVAFTKCGDENAFFGACLHGVVMGFSERMSTNELANQCKNIEKQDLLLGRNCAHGVGHIIFGTRQNITYVECQTYFFGQLFHDCVSGILMEYMLGTHKKLISNSQPTSPFKTIACSSVDIAIQADCASAIGSYSLYDASADPGQTARLCMELSGQNLIDSCVKAALFRLKGAGKTTQESFKSAVQ